VSAAAKAIASKGLTRRALSLGAVKGFDHALQFLLPVVLVRCLDAATFGEYRLLWLAVGTVMAVATLNMPEALYFFLPRSDPPTRRLYIQQTLVFLAVSGLVCAFAVSPWNPIAPEAIRPFAQYGALVPAFVALWVMVSILDLLPTVDERVSWQAYATVSVALTRAVLLAAGAWFSGDMRVLLWLLLGVALLRLVLLLAYVQRHHGWGRPWFRVAQFVDHTRCAVPFGAASALYALRNLADQWIAASLFALHSFAAFSIAAIVGPLVHVLRSSVLEAFLPSMSRMHAAGDVRGMLEMNARANVMVARLLYPLLGFLFVFAEEVVTLVYTKTYVGAAPAMRVYIAGVALLAIEVGSVVLLLREGPFCVVVGMVALAVSVFVSWEGAQHLGLAGAAAGSVVALYLDRLLTLRRISRRARVPLARLQYWGTLGRLVLSTALASAIAWSATRIWLASSTGFARAVVGAALIALLYAAAEFYFLPKVKAGDLRAQKSL
jgi:O-antigen/teichoic acid export membrane protein